MRNLFFLVLFLMGSAAHAVVLTEAELRDLEAKQVRNAYSEPITLQHVEYQPYFKKGKFKYLNVYAESVVRVNINDLEYPFPWWKPFSSAKGEMKRLMRTFCRDLGGAKIKKKKYTQVSEDKLKFRRFPTWNVGMTMSFRCQ